MNFEQYLIQQTQRHPSTQPQDIIKQCYQSAFGAEHLLADPDRALRYLKQEYDATPAADLPLYEVISHRICRVNLAAWKAHDLPIQWLFRMFLATARAVSPAFDPTEGKGVSTDFERYLDTADHMIRQGRLTVSFSLDEWTRYLSEYRAAGIHAVHHSNAYRQNEQPAYRILQCQFLRLLPILETVTTHPTYRQADPMNSPLVIAIDGRAASGKTIMADQLVDILDAEVIRMDDFFLPPALRTPERLQTPGGNVHYERFIEEVLPQLRSAAPFFYRRFDCHIMDYNGVREVTSRPIRIVEGSYSCHPALGDYADITVFSTVKPEAQMRRILHRNGPDMAEIFRTRWIPMEEDYIRHSHISSRCTVLIDSTDLF